MLVGASTRGVAASDSDLLESSTSDILRFLHVPDGYDKHEYHLVFVPDIDENLWKSVSITKSHTGITLYIHNILNVSLKCIRLKNRQISRRES